MGIDICCGDKSFCCSYSTWGEARIAIIKATIEYVQDKFDKDKELYKDLPEGDENWIGEGSEYYCYMTDLREAEDILLSQTPIKTVFGLPFDNTVNNFIKLCNNLKYMNALNYFELGGLYALCNQSDCEGYYTPGNSLDICALFDRIEPFVKKYMCYDFIYTEEGRAFNTVYAVFEHSYKTLKKVTIC
jgi:hypothetical protein